MDLKLKIKANELKERLGIKDGHTPTTEELVALIKPLIPVVKDGHTPTEDELKKIIEPLIPNTDALVRKIQSLIRIPEDGKDGRDGRDGKDGRDGSPDRPEDIVRKLESLPQGKRLNYNFLDNTPTRFPVTGNIDSKQDKMIYDTDYDAFLVDY